MTTFLGIVYNADFTITKKVVISARLSGACCNSTACPMNYTQYETQLRI